MKKVSVIIGLLLLAASLAAIRPAGAEGADPLSVWNAFEAALNRADVDAVADTFADDAVFVDTHPSPGLPGVWIGKEQIRELFKGIVHPGDRQTSSSFLINSGGSSEQLAILDVKQWFAPGVDLPPGLPQPLELKQYLV